MKTINFELSKRLNEAGLLDNIKTEKIFFENGWMGDAKKFIGKDFHGNKIYKILTVEEAIEFLPNRIDDDNNAYYLNITKAENKYHICYESDLEDYVENGIEIFKSCILNNEHIFGETLLEAIEKMLERLLDNNLLEGKKHQN